MKRVGKILCAVDFSRFSRDAFEAALDETEAWGAALTLMHVYEPPFSLPPEAFNPEALRKIAADAEAQLAAWQKDAAARGLSIDTFNTMGVPWERIVRTAQEGVYDLIVVGTHGRSGIMRALLGSVAERVVRHASCSVLTVRPHR